MGRDGLGSIGFYGNSFGKEKHSLCRLQIRMAYPFVPAVAVVSVLMLIGIRTPEEQLVGITRGHESSRSILPVRLGIHKHINHGLYFCLKAMESSCVRRYRSTLHKITTSERGWGGGREPCFLVGDA